MTLTANACGRKRYGGGIIWSGRPVCMRAVLIAKQSVACQGMIGSYGGFLRLERICLKSRKEAESRKKDMGEFDWEKRM